MKDTYSLADIDEQLDTLLSMMEGHEDLLYGVIDSINQVQDEIKHLLSQNIDTDE